MSARETNCSPSSTRSCGRSPSQPNQHERRDHTLEPNAVVSELCVRLMGNEPLWYQDRAHFFAIAAQTMRRILIDHARARVAGKRGGQQFRVALSDVEGWRAPPASEELLDLDTLLSALERLDPRAVRVVNRAFFRWVARRGDRRDPRRFRHHRQA